MHNWYILPRNLFYLLILSDDQKTRTWYYVLRPDERDVIDCVMDFNGTFPYTHHAPSAKPAMATMPGHGTLEGNLDSLSFTLVERSFER